MSGWISVKDKMPESSDPVLCRVQMKGDYPTVVHFEASYWEDAEVFEWSDWCGDTDTYDGWSVTHWQPLPKPPEE